MHGQDFAEKSYWLTTRPYEPGSPLEGEIDVDVAIVGGGFTGLSTAHFLKETAPHLRVAVLEAEAEGRGLWRQVERERRRGLAYESHAPAVELAFPVAAHRVEVVGLDAVREGARRDGSFTRSPR